jgi:hypothetical protein
MIGTEQSLSPALQEKLLTRSALRLGIDASTFDVVAENLRTLETIWFWNFINSELYSGMEERDVACYRAYREDRINALLDES